MVIVYSYVKFLEGNSFEYDGKTIIEPTWTIMKQHDLTLLFHRGTMIQDEYMTGWWVQPTLVQTMSSSVGTTWNSRMGHIFRSGSIHVPFTTKEMMKAVDHYVYVCIPLHSYLHYSYSLYTYIIYIHIIVYV